MDSGIFYFIIFTTCVQYMRTNAEANVKVFKFYQCYDDNKKSYADKMKTECLYAHNELRALHGVPKLKWSSQLERTAKAHLTDMAEKNLLVHSSASDQQKGENIGKKEISIKGIVFGPATMITKWYNEIKSFPFNNPNAATGNSGHFSQVVWKSTTHVGCALASSEREDSNWVGTYICCQYSPAGNLDGDYDENVLPTTSGKVETIADPSTIDVQGCCDYSAVCGSFCKRYCHFIKDVCCDACSSSERCAEVRANNNG